MKAKAAVLYEYNTPLIMAGEWTTWALEQRKGWKLAPATFLVGMALFEANQVRERGERLFSLNGEAADPGQPWRRPAHCDGVHYKP